MSKQTQSKTIDGFNYDVTQLPGRAGVKFLAKLARLLGPSMGSLVTAIQKSGGKLAGADLTLVSAAVGRIFQDLNEQEVDAMFQELLATATYLEGDKIRDVLKTFDAHFQGRTGSALKLLAFALEVNYGNFFDALGSVLAPSPVVATTDPS